MAVAVRVLMLLACGPLLAPPGACVCRAAAAHREAPDPHGCCGRHHGPAEPTPPDPDPDHAPGCPAAGDGVPRAEPPATDLPAFAAVVGPFLPPAAEPRPPDRPAPTRPGSPPLYLSHCALLR